MEAHRPGLVRGRLPASESQPLHDSLLAIAWCSGHSVRRRPLPSMSCRSQPWCTQVARSPPGPGIIHRGLTLPPIHAAVSLCKRAWRSCGQGLDGWHSQASVSPAGRQTRLSVPNTTKCSTLLSIQRCHKMRLYFYNVWPLGRSRMHAAVTQTGLESRLTKVFFQNSQIRCLLRDKLTSALRF